MMRACARRARKRRRRRAMRGAIAAALVPVLLGAAPATLVAEWAVKPGAAGCVVESTAESLSDGYQMTTARIRVDGKMVSVVSPSVLDPGLNDIAIFVDQQGMVALDRLADPRTAVFESRYPGLVDQFKRGLSARVQLRFWPTWPVTGPHSVSFSLLGFTRAYGRLDECK
jgi:hypothetical protein